MDPEKVWGISEREAPWMRKQLESFLSFANFYQPLISMFAQTALPITNLLKTKGVTMARPTQPLKWSLECQVAFE